MIRTLGMALALWAASTAAHAGDRVALAEVSKGTHVHGLAYSAESLTLATHDGVWRADAEGMAERIAADGHDHPLALEPDLIKRPEDATSFAAVAGEDGRLYAASPRGLLLTRDSGGSWATIYRRESPVTAVGTAGGMVYAYVPQVGLVATSEPPTAFRRLGDPATGAEIVRIAVDPADRRRLAVIDAVGRIAVSTDGGGSWKLFAP